LDIQFVVLLEQDRADEVDDESSREKMPTTSMRRLISPLVDRVPAGLGGLGIVPRARQLVHLCSLGHVGDPSWLYGSS